jgi:hypothetical protein
MAPDAAPIEGVNVKVRSSMIRVDLNPRFISEI